MNRRLIVAGLVAISLAATAAVLPAQTAAQPYKLGTFAQGTRVFLGLVLDDRTVIDLSKADAVLPTDMKTLMERYDSVKSRLASIAAGAARSRPAAAIDVMALKIMPPVMPQNILNAAVNYVEHGKEMQGQRQGDTPPAADAPKPIPGIWERASGDARQNPYVFVKPVGAVVGSGDAIRLPPGRDQIDWECELSIVVGRTASRVSAADAGGYIFGYTLQNDVSDRAGRSDGRYGGSDWFIGKGHDTFAPLGPFIVPKEFVPDPQRLGIRFTLSGTVMQDSNTERMTHTVWEMLSYVSHVLTLKPGDIVSTGSPAGVGAARKVFMKAGDTAVCTIDKIGTLTNPVVGPPGAGGNSR